jgi:hypothetical protein
MVLKLPGVWRPCLTRPLPSGASCTRVRTVWQALATTGPLLPGVCLAEDRV